MMANHKLAAAVGDLGAYEFKRQLLYKAEFFATKLEKAPNEVVVVRVGDRPINACGQ
ncbi:MAG: hypothetical protein DSM107014_10515 [Gomphosphaeria aponina SAG 52.96 = DSM 107014]|uniref:Uncharacterized protein n=1 Tax=Gomphosphaeria aponina SAG 52.96 = DSM 107014 TaxID=1521640 RepID=A0A941JV52_9CHRO|nr:hypothetical protein [Gomphosphaeria aponina SAG 52.96 = DSM 107014]